MIDYVLIIHSVELSRIEGEGGARGAGDEPLPGQSLMTLAVWPRSVFVVPMYYTTWMSATSKTKIFLLRSYAAPARAQLRCSASASPSARRHSLHTYTCGAGARAWWGSGRAGERAAQPLVPAPSRARSPRAGGSTRGCGRARVPSCERGCARACNRPPGRDLGACCAAAGHGGGGQDRQPAVAG